MTFRKWLAWKLVQVAARLYDAEWEESITITTPTGDGIEIDVLGDEYGCGISGTSGIAWGPGETAVVNGWAFTWHEPEHK